MAMTVGQYCAQPGCGAIVHRGYCATHRVVAMPKRESAAMRGYDRVWRVKRLAYLRANPLCVECEQAGHVVAANEVDHRIPLSQGGADEESNYQALCKSCHSRKTAHEVNSR